MLRKKTENVPFDVGFWHTWHPTTGYRRTTNECIRTPISMNYFKEWSCQSKSFIENGDSNQQTFSINFSNTLASINTANIISLTYQSLLLRPTLLLPPEFLIPPILFSGCSPAAIRGQMRLERAIAIGNDPNTTPTLVVTGKVSLSSNSNVISWEARVEFHVKKVKQCLTGNNPTPIVVDEVHVMAVRAQLTKPTSTSLTVVDSALQKKMDAIRALLIKDKPTSSHPQTVNIQPQKEPITQDTQSKVQSDNSHSPYPEIWFQERRDAIKAETASQLSNLGLKTDQKILSRAVDNQLKVFSSKEQVIDIGQTLFDNNLEFRKYAMQRMQQARNPNREGYQPVTLPLAGAAAAYVMGGLAVVWLAGQNYLRTIQNKNEGIPPSEPTYDEILRDNSTEFPREESDLLQSNGSGKYERPKPTMHNNNKVGGFQKAPSIPSPKGRDYEADKSFMDTLFIYNRVKLLQTGKYKDLNKDADPHDCLHHDHWPSAAAIIKAKEELRGKKLSKEEKREIIKNTNAIVITEDLHRKSRSWGGRNTKSQIEEDSRDLAAAAARDSEEFRKNALKEKIEPELIDEAIEKMHRLNRASGLYK